MRKDYLYSPWRLDYILSEKTDCCIFCCKPSFEDDARQLIVHRTQFSFVIINVYPYNNGHVMVVPLNHVANLASLDPEELTDLFMTVQLTESILYEVYKCEGINIGLNIGKAAGAGVDEHVHVHLVPRWSGDCNFMSVIGGKRVIPEDFATAYHNIKTAYEQRTKTKKT